MRSSRVALLSLAGLAIALVSVALLSWLLARSAWSEGRLAGWLAERLGVRVALRELAIGYFPTPWAEVGGVVLGAGPDEASPVVLEVEGARVELPWRTVLGRSLRIDDLALTAPGLHLAIDESGEASWTALVEGIASFGDGKEGKAWSIGRIELAAGSLGYRDARSGTVLDLTGIALSASDVAPRERFPLELRAAGQYAEYTFHAALDGWARFDPDAGAYAGKDLAFRGWLGGGGLGLGGVELAGAAEAVQADLVAGTLGVHELGFDGLGLQVAGDIEVTGLDTDPTVAFELATEPFAPRAVANTLNVALPATTSPAALARAELRARGGWNEAAGLTVGQLEGRLDDSIVTGSVALRPGGAPAELRLAIDAVVLDGYLPPPADPPPSLAAALESLLGELRALDVDAEIGIGRAEAAGVVARGLRVVVEPNLRDGAGSER